ncbi:hypothetical protein D3C75_800390 [compost metagenome]
MFNQRHDVFVGHDLIVVTFALLGAHGHQDDGFAKGLFLIANVAVGHMSPWDRRGLSLLCRRAAETFALPEVSSTAGRALRARISGRNLSYSLPEPFNMSNDFRLRGRSLSLPRCNYRCACLASRHCGRFLRLIIFDSQAATGHLYLMPSATACCR